MADPFPPLSFDLVLHFGQTSFTLAAPGDDAAKWVRALTPDQLRELLRCPHCLGVGFDMSARTRCAPCKGSGRIDHAHEHMGSEDEQRSRILRLDAGLTKLTQARDRDLKRAGEAIQRLHWAIEGIAARMTPSAVAEALKVVEETR